MNELDGIRLVKGNVLDIARYVVPGSVRCIVTSPPYYLQRAYENQPEDVRPWLCSEYSQRCDHEWEDCGQRKQDPIESDKMQPGEGDTRKRTKPNRAASAPSIHHGHQCKNCGAWIGNYGHEPRPDLYVRHTLHILALLQPLLTPDGTLWFNIDDKYGQRGGAQRCGIPEQIVVGAQQLGYRYLQDVIWAKRGPKPESIRNRPARAFEHVYMFCPGRKNYYDWKAVGTPYSESTIRELTKPYTGQSHGDYEAVGAEDPSNLKRRIIEKAQVERLNGRPLLARPKNVQNWPTSQSHAHFATFPEELAEWCIASSTEPGDLVLDPFAGSGTVGAVCRRLGRRAVLLDLAYQGDQLSKIGAAT